MGPCNLIFGRAQITNKSPTMPQPGPSKLRYACKRGSLRLTALRPQQPQEYIRAYAAARKWPQLFCGFCGSPHAAASLAVSELYDTSVSFAYLLVKLMLLRFVKAQRAS